MALGVLEACNLNNPTLSNAVVQCGVGDVCEAACQRHATTRAHCGVHAVFMLRFHEIVVLEASVRRKNMYSQHANFKNS